MKAKRILSLLFILILVLAVALCACDSNPNPDSDGNNPNGTTNTEPVNKNMVNQTEYDAPYSLGKSESGKATLLNRQQVPQIMLSTLLRADLLKTADFMEAEDMEDYFAIAKQTNMNTIELSVMWSQIEPEYDEYDFSDLKCYLDFAKKYGLKINIEWYGSLVDGEAHMVNVPKYIADDESKYPVIKDMFDFANYGRCKVMDWSNADLIIRESQAIYNMMNYVYDWNKQNDLYDPVMMVQIGQGADRFQRWRVNAYGVSMSADEAWSMVHTYLNEIARGVKYSKYKALTRVEFCEQNAVVNFVRNVEKLQFVDVVCPTYLHEVSSTKNGIRSFIEEYEDMPIFNVENWASDINHKQTLATFGMGGSGYVSYQLSCPNYYPESPNGALYKRYNAEGATLDDKFEQKNTRATDTAAINAALAKAYVAVANAPRARFASFGLNNLLNNREGEERVQKIYLTNGLLLSFSNPADSLGFAIYDNNYLYVFSSKDAQMVINNCSITVGQKGYFDASGEWVNQGNVTLANNTTLNLAANEVYRVRIVNVSDLPSAANLRDAGYLSTLDSIRG